jgi:hypothetical protein
MHHVAYTFASLEELFQRYVELKEKGVEPTMPIQHGMTTSLYYEDPDGNFVEMQVDNFASPDQATAYMYGPEFDGDPIGHAFSPEALLASLRAGVPAAELATRAWALAHPFESDREMPQTVKDELAMKRPGKPCRIRRWSSSAPGPWARRWPWISPWLALTSSSWSPESRASARAPAPTSPTSGRWSDGSLLINMPGALGSAER